MHGRIAIFTLAILTGCTELPDVEVPRNVDKPRLLAQAFDENTTGTIEGVVRWEGELPAEAQTDIRSVAYNPRMFQKPAHFSTPNVPQIDPQSSGIAGAVVYLKNVDPAKSRPWDHPKPSIEFRDRQLHILQAATDSRVGFAHVGSQAEIVNRDDEYHVLRARGNAFFSASLIEANKPQERSLSSPGVVELTCGAGYFWLNAHLFVVQHPYYVRTDGKGRFVLDRVPEGDYELVCWLPSWHVLRSERDPETADVSRWIWAAPREQTTKVRVERGTKSDAVYRWTLRMFGED